MAAPPHISSLVDQFTDDVETHCYTYGGAGIDFEPLSDENSSLWDADDATFAAHIGDQGQPSGSYDALCFYVDSMILSGFHGRVPGPDAAGRLDAIFGGKENIRFPVHGLIGKMTHFGFAFLWEDPTDGTRYIVRCTGCTD